MPTYRITNPTTGQKIRMTGSTPPSQVDIDTAFKTAGGSVATPKAPSVQGFGENIVKSGINALGDMGNAAVNVFNPVKEQNTLYNVGKLATGVMNKTPVGMATNFLTSGFQSPEVKQFKQESNDALGATGDFYAKRYGVDKALSGDFGGAVKQAGDTAYTDPVGVALDISTVAGGVGAVSGGSRFGKIANTVAKVTDPISMTTRGTGKVFSKLNKSKIGLDNLGNKIEQAGKEYGVKSTRINQTGQNLMRNTGEPLDAYLSRTKLYGQDVQKVNDFIKPLQEQFDTKTINSGKSIPKSQLSSVLREKAQALLIDEGGLPTTSVEHINAAKKLQEQADLVDQLPVEDIGLDYLTRERRRLDEATNFNKFDNTYDKKLKGDTYREVLNKEAGSTALGKELNKAYTFRKALEKAPKGKANLPFNLNRGVAMAGLQGTPFVGPLAGLMLEGVLNNPKMIGKTSEVLQDLGRTFQLKKAPKGLKTFGKGVEKGYTFSKYASRQKGEE